MDSINPANLPLEIRSRLAELQLELSEGDITDKGYQKKKSRLLTPFFDQQVDDSQLLGPQPNACEPRSIPIGGVQLPGLAEIVSNNNNNKNGHHRTRQLTPNESSHSAYDRGGPEPEAGDNEPPQQQQNNNHRAIHNDVRYFSDIREDAVREALIRNRNDRHGAALYPSRRAESIRNSCHQADAQFDTDEDSDGGEESVQPPAPSSSSDHPHNPVVVSRFPPVVLNPLSQLLQSDYTNCTATTTTTSGSQQGSSNALPADAAAVDSYDLVADTCDLQPRHQAAGRQANHNGHHPYLPSSSSMEASPSHNIHASSGSINSSASQPTNGIHVSQGQPYFQSPALPGVNPPCGGISVLPRFPVANSNNNLSSSTSAEPPISSVSQPQLPSSVANLPPPVPTSTSQLPPNGNCNGGNGNNGLVVCPNRISDKIQQLVNTLKRPKRRPLPEYFLDEDDQVLVRPASDPEAPLPTGPPSTPLMGGELSVSSGYPRNLESALQRYAGLSSRSVVATCLDPSNRSSQTLTYAKLLQRSMRIAYLLLNKLGHRGDQSLKPRDRVALIYANNEPISFMAAFYGCLLASVTPVAIEVPSARRDASCQSMGFLLSSLDARVVLTSEQCYKALPRSSNGDIVNYPRWPRVSWINTDQLTSGGGSSCKPPKDWIPPDRLSPEETMYTEYVFSKDGSVHGVTVSRRAALAHCLALTSACRYSEEEVMVCVVDHRRETGLWHAVLTSVFNGMHVVFVPYSVMQVDPGSWLRVIGKYRASIAVVKSRDMHWALLAERDHQYANLSSLRMLIVADGSNPWSLNSCDSFVEKFRSRGLSPSAICPSAGTSQTLTLCLRRPSRNADPKLVQQLAASNGTANDSVRGVISIHSLTYGVVRMDSEESLTSLVLQDCGQVLPNASAVVVRLGPQPIICQADELGEICLASESVGSGYWGLRGLTDSHFHVEPFNLDGSPVYSPPNGTKQYTRSGYLGFSSPNASGGVVFVCGSIDGLMTVDGRRHNADDLVATVLAVQPTKLVYRGRIAIFSIDLLKDERVVIIAELRQGFSDEAAFTWMSMVLQAVDHIHQVNVYCLALVQQHTLPRTPFGGVNRYAVQRLFTDGQLHPSALLLCPHSAVHNLPQPRQPPARSQVGPSAIMVGQVVQGVRMAEASGRALAAAAVAVDSNSNSLIDHLIRRAAASPDDRLFTVYNQKRQEAATLTASQLLKRAERLAVLLLDKAKAAEGTRVVLLYPPGTEMLCAFYACLLIGAIPVPVRPPRLDNSAPAQQQQPPPPTSSNQPSSSPGFTLASLTGPAGAGSSGALGTTTSNSGASLGSGSSWSNVYMRPVSPSLQAGLELVWSVLIHSGASMIMTQTSLVKLLKSKEATAWIPFSHWPLVLDSDECPRKKTVLPPPVCTTQPIAYLDFAASTTGTLTGVAVTHQVASAMCRAQKMQCEFYASREVVLSLDSFSGLGFTLWALTSVYCGHHSILIPPSVTEAVPDLWLTVCSQRKVRDAFCSHFTMELTARHLSKALPMLKQREVSLSNLRSLVVVGEERPRVQLTSTFVRLFSAIGLSSRAVSTSFGCRVNLAISLQGANSPESTTVYVDRLSLRNDRIKLLEKGSPNSLCLIESGKLLPGVHVAIANPDTMGQCADSQLGELWVSSPHNSTELLGPFASASLNRSASSNSSSSGSPESPLSNRPAASESLSARLVTGDTGRVYARTGFLGFVRRTDLTQADGELHDAIFVVGSLEEAIVLRGMRYHPIDIENTVMRAHRKICECAVFTWSNLLVVVAELSGAEAEAMDLVHPITASVLTEHQLIVGVVVVTDPGTVPVNSCGEKQRILLRDRFVNDKLDPIYVSYNM